MKETYAAFLLVVTLCIPLSTHGAQSASRVTLRDLGVLQLAAHDLFRVDRDIEENLENDMLDLSTVFDHGDDEIIVGGEIRNSENVAVFTIATQYAREYLDMIDHGTSVDTARSRIVRHYHSDLTHAVSAMIDGRLDEMTTGSTTMTEDLAFRVIHDFLPNAVVVDGQSVPILSPSLFRHTLTDAELAAPSASMDGVVDEVFRFITFFTPEGLTVVDLLERDHSFAEQFETDFSFEHFLNETADGALDPAEDATRLIRALIAKGMGNYHAAKEYGCIQCATAPTPAPLSSDTTSGDEAGSELDHHAAPAQNAETRSSETRTDDIRTARTPRVSR